MSVVVELKNLHKRFGSVEVLRGVSLSVRRGEVVAIIGRSGSGKSTALRCIDALETIDQGEIHVCGHAVHDEALDLAQLRRDVGMGDGNVHFNPLRPADQDAKAYLEQHYKLVSRTVDDLVYGLNGSISAEHGIGVAKRDDLFEYKSQVDIELMWQVKKAIDPKNLLNPKKLLPVIGG